MKQITENQRPWVKLGSRWELDKALDILWDLYLNASMRDKPGLELAMATLQQRKEQQTNKVKS